MLKHINAVIFDMDGVIIDSEPLWRRAMIKGFKEFDIIISEDDCRKSMGTRLIEVIDFWTNYFSINKFSNHEIETVIINQLIEFIKIEGKAIPGVLEILNFCKEKKLKIGLATSSSEKLMQAILEKLQFIEYFDSMVSAEKLKYGKPHPEVFLICAANLGIKPANCIVIEDSLTGAIAAKAAQMQLIVVPDKETKNKEKFVIADYHLKTMDEVINLFK